MPIRSLSPVLSGWKSILFMYPPNKKKALPFTSLTAGRGPSYGRDQRQLPTVDDVLDDGATGFATKLHKKNTRVAGTCNRIRVPPSFKFHH